MATQGTTYVYIHLAGAFVPAGRMTVVEDAGGGFAEFEYGRGYLARRDRIEIDPQSLGFAPEPTQAYRTGEGFVLFGAIRDAAPDAWGRHVLDRAAYGRPLSELDYLTAAGDDRIGALGFGPDLRGPQRTLLGPEPAHAPDEPLDLPALLRAADTMDGAGDLDPALRSFIVRGSSLGGARPKAITQWKGRPALAKFGRADDNMNVCRVEFATMRLAARCGIDVPDVGLAEAFGRDIYLIRRFDRASGGIRHHFISGLTLLGAHESEGTKYAYSDLADHLRQKGDRFAADAAELWRRMVFNILCGNDDDHLRNHGFLHHQGRWRLSPVYDLVPHPQAGEIRRLALGVGEAGRDATVENALSRSPSFGLRLIDARRMASQMRRTCQDWRKFYASCGVPARDLHRLQSCFVACEAPDSSTRRLARVPALPARATRRRRPQG